MIASFPDLLRLLVVPVLGWAAWRDVRTRRVPNRTWLPLAGLGIALLLWDAYTILSGDTLGRRLFLFRVGLSLGFVVPLSYALWRIGGFGGADAKAFMVLAVVFPTYPVYYLPTTTLPLVETTVGVFALTILSNTVVLAVAYPLLIAVDNLWRGRIDWPMLVGRPIPAGSVTDEFGRLLVSTDGFTRSGLDLDALRMYLRWRGCSLADLRSRPDRYRDPASLPEEPNPPGDGGIVPDGGDAVDEDPPDGTADDSASPDGEREEPGVADDVADDAPSASAGEARPAADDRGTDTPGESGADTPDDTEPDPWGARAFLDDVDHAYGTSPEQLRDGLDVLVAADEVWISPGIPFLVPTFFGLVVALTYGDLLFALLGALGFV